MPKEIKPFEKTKDKKAFVSQYTDALKMEKFLKQRMASLAAGQARDQELLQQVQMGMQLMIKGAEGTVFNGKEPLDGMEGEAQ